MGTGIFFKIAFYICFLFFPFFLAFWLFIDRTAEDVTGNRLGGGGVCDTQQVTPRPGLEPEDAAGQSLCMGCLLYPLSWTVPL